MNAHDFSLDMIDGSQLQLNTLKGKKILLVNTASYCGLTHQYAQLEELHRNFRDQVTVIGLPCNDFANQEPDSEASILQFCSTRYDVNFPLTKKISIKKDSHPLYQWLTQKSMNGKMDSDVSWNFQKYLIDENGDIQAVFSPVTEVFSDEVLSAIGISL
jgi:glutathione peroxidase